MPWFVIGQFANITPLKEPRSGTSSDLALAKGVTEPVK